MTARYDGLVEEELDARSRTAAQWTRAAGAQSSAEDRICPFLGVARDPQSRFSHPSAGHVCHAGKPAEIGLAYQAQYCLSGSYERCVRFERAVGHNADGQPLSAASGRSWLTIVGAGLLAFATLAGVIALVVAGGLLTSPPDGGPFGVASSTPTPAAVTEAPVVPSPTTVEPAPASAPPAATPSPTRLPTPEPSPTPVEVHVVQAGESLSIISDLYGLPWQLIAQANDIEDPDRIFVGQRLVIPATAEPGPGELVHYVQRGETILDIAFTYGVSPSELADANGLENWNRIYIGQRLVIPGGEVESPGPEAGPTQ